MQLQESAGAVLLASPHSLVVAVHTKTEASNSNQTTEVKTFTIHQKLDEGQQSEIALTITAFKDTEEGLIDTKSFLERSNSNQKTQYITYNTSSQSEGLQNFQQSFTNVIQWSQDQFLGALVNGIYKLSQLKRNIFVSQETSLDIISLLKNGSQSINTKQHQDFELTQENAQHMLIHIDKQVEFFVVNFKSTSEQQLQQAKKFCPAEISKIGQLSLTLQDLQQALEIIATTAEGLPSLQKIVDDAFTNGTSTNCDLTVKDIYGANNCSVIGLSEDLIASQLGKVHESTENYSSYDLARSLLNGFAMEIAQIGSLYAQERKLKNAFLIIEPFNNAFFELVLSKLFFYYSSQTVQVYSVKEATLTALVGSTVN